LRSKLIGGYDMMTTSTRYIRPGKSTSIFNAAVAGLTKLGISVWGSRVLFVRGRTSGEWRTVPVNVLELEGTRYLVAPRGETQWVRNLRVVGEGELRRRGKAERFRAVEVPDQDKPRLIEAYLARWGAQARSYFKTLPDPADHPVFRVEPQQ